MMRISLVLAVTVCGSLMEEVVQLPAVLMAQIGHTVTMQCFYSIDSSTYLLWYKQELGGKPRLICSMYKYNEGASFYNEFKDNVRFTLNASMGENHLTIRDLQPSDSAMYYCGKIEVNSLEYGNGTLLIMDRGGPSLSVRVTQQPAASVPAQPGDSVTLQCTVDSGSCAGEHSVYWFTLASGESQPGVIYSHGGRSAECEKSPEAGSVPQSCVYSLPVNHADTYYCAVAACGHMVLGNGTTVVHGGTTGVSEIMVWLSIIRAAILLCVTLILSIIYGIASHAANNTRGTS